MPSVHSKRSTIMTRLVTIVSSLAVILVLVPNACAQSQVTVTASPPAVTDASKPGDVVLHVTKIDGSAIDATFVSQLRVNVGGTDAAIKSTDIPNGNITITPPGNLTGSQRVQLFGANNQSLGETQLQYPAAASSTPGPIEIRQNSLSQSWWYRIAVLVLFALLLVVFGYTIYRVIRFSRSSFRNAAGFPVGSFRAILAFTLVAYLGFYILASILSITSFPIPDSLLGIVATVIGFYFGSRSTEEGAEAGPAGVVRGLVNAGTNPARGALVKFKRDDGTEPYIRVTDVEGRFAPVNAKPGKYTVRAEVTGLPPGEVTITVSDGSDQEIVIPVKTAQTPTPPTTGTVQGTVTKADNTTVQGASVVLSQGNTTQQKTTDASGKYKFENVAVGDYNIVASSAGLSSGSKPITVAAGAPQTVDLQLKQG